jgi:hypothetical protein
MSRPALEVADIFRDHGAAWRSANAGHVSLDQLKVMSAIERCRTAALGGHVVRCENCSHTLIAYNSCRNERHGFLVALTLCHHDPSHPRDLLGKRDLGSGAQDRLGLGIARFLELLRDNRLTRSARGPAVGGDVSDQIRVEIRALPPKPRQFHKSIGLNGRLITRRPTLNSQFRHP